MQKLLGKGVEFDKHPYESITGENNHPLYLEFNIQHDCKAYGIIPAPDMHEFKIEIPFTKTKDVN